MKREQKSVSKIISTNINTSLQAVEKYKELAGKYEETEGKIINAYEQLETVIDKGQNHIISFFTMISDKLGILIEIQQWILGQYMDFKAIIFYISTLIIILISTAFKSTISSRFPLLFFTILNYFAELTLTRLVVTYPLILSRALCGKSDEMCELIKTMKIISYERGLFILIDLLIYSYYLLTYKNYQKVNNDLLLKMEKKFRYAEKTPYRIHRHFLSMRRQMENLLSNQKLKRRRK